MAKDFFGTEIILGAEVAFMQTGYRSLMKGTVTKITNDTLIISHPRTNVGKTETKQHSGQVIVNPKPKVYCVGCEEMVDSVSDDYKNGYKLCNTCNDKYDNQTGHCSLSCSLGHGCDQTC